MGGLGVLWAVGLWAAPAGAFRIMDFEGARTESRRWVDEAHGSQSSAFSAGHRRGWRGGSDHGLRLFWKHDWDDDAPESRWWAHASGVFGHSDAFERWKAVFKSEDDDKDFPPFAWWSHAFRSARRTGRSTRTSTSMRTCIGLRCLSPAT